MKINYYIEQCDNGIVIADKTRVDERTVAALNVVLDDDIVSTLGKMFWEEINCVFDGELKNAADIEINITTREGKL